MSLPRVDIEQPMFPQDSYLGRAKHFYILTNPLNVTACDERLDRARITVNCYRAAYKKALDKGQETVPCPPYVQNLQDLWRAKYLYDSAFNSEGEKQLLIGRMSFQMPANTLISSAMIAAASSRNASIFWQWVNQTYMAILNYTNRSGTANIPRNDLLMSYLLATSGAVGTTVAFQKLTTNMPPLIRTFVPFVAVCAANCINVPFMRSYELKNGIAVYDENKKEVGKSKRAAAIATGMVLATRILSAIPPFIIPPLLVHHLEKKCFFENRACWRAPVSIAAVAASVAVGTPLMFAIFRQYVEIDVDQLEPEVRDQIHKEHPNLKVVTFNKGL